MPAERTPVLIVGGSLVGLSAAMFLAQQGVDVLLVEKHDTISEHPRAQASSPRTMEILRPYGLEDAVRAKETANARYGDIVQVESLAGAERGWFDGPFRFEQNAVSATGWTLIGQDKLEPILHEQAVRAGADIRFSTELVSFTQDADGVDAVLRNPDGSRTAVRADYLVAADGFRSGIRSELGIGTHGKGVFGKQMIVMFRADLTSYVRDRQFFLCFVSNDRVHGVLGQLGESADGRWCLALSLQPGEKHEDYTVAHCEELLRAAVGDEAVELVVEDVNSWEIAAQVADSFRDRRVFLAGDSAHLMPPTGGFGGNLGLQDAHNLAWKLAAVLRGAAGPELLDSYQDERLPLAEVVMEQGVIRYLQRSGLDEEAAARHRPESTVLFGHYYGEPATTDLDVRLEDPTAPSGRPGTRAPHITLRRGLEEIGVHDLCTGGFLLLTADERWADASAVAAAAVDVRVDEHLLDSPSFHERYGVGQHGAVLVRPDGFIAASWDGLPYEPALDLTDALRAVLKPVTSLS